MITTTDHGPYTIKSIKTWTGHEGMGGFSATIYKNGKKIGTVLNNDDGGPNYWRFLDQKASKSQDCVDLTAHARESVKPEHKDYCEVEDIWFIDVLGDYEEHKRLKRYCKKETLMRFKDDKEGSFRRAKAIYSVRFHQEILKMYGDKVEIVLDSNAEVATI